MKIPTDQIIAMSKAAGPRAEQIFAFDPNAFSSPAEFYQSIRATDQVAAGNEQDHFDEKVRRAYQLGYLKDKGFHKAKKLSWHEFVTQDFPWGGYAVWRRYYPCSLVQIELLKNGFPLAQNEFQTRLLAPLLRKPDGVEISKLRELVAAEGGVLPQACEIKAAFPKTPSPAKKTAPNTTPPVNPFQLVLASYTIQPRDQITLRKLATKYDPTAFPQPELSTEDPLVDPPVVELDLFSTQPNPTPDLKMEVVDAR